MSTASRAATPPHGPGLLEVEALLRRPLLELVFVAASTHRRHHDPATIQCSQLLNIKTGGCSEDCGYCSQSAHFETSVERAPLMPLQDVIAAAREAQAAGADRFCMGAAWREVRDGEDFDRVLEMVRGVKALGLETCVTLGMVTAHHAERLRAAGLDFYNHNLDTGPSHYGEVVGTHSFEDRLETLQSVRQAGIRICAGGILGLGETHAARAELLYYLAGLEPQPESVPVNALVPVEGTPMQENSPVDWSELVRVVAAARVLMPRAAIRLSAGRSGMDEAAQALCFLAGANSIFVGEQLLTTPNPTPGSDAALLAKLGLRPLAQGS